MTTPHALRPLVVTLVLSAAPPAALAQEDPKYVLTHKQTKAPAPTDCKCPDETPKPEKPPSPWELKFRVGSLFQFNSNKGVVGQRDGSSRSFGAEVHAEANWTGGKHEVRNRLDVAAVFIKTPNLSSWVTASNMLEFETIYQYRVARRQRVAGAARRDHLDLLDARADPHLRRVFLGSGDETMSTVTGEERRAVRRPVARCA